MPNRVLIAMSGGVDSSVAAARLVDRGMDVIGVTLHLWDEPDPGARSRCCAPEDIRDAKRVADQLHIRHYSLDRRDLFASFVVRPFVDAYLEGLTPSPCATCNQRIKIPALLRAAQLMGADAVATGHYARIISTPEGLRVARGADRRKDQSYFLCALDQPTLSKLMLPLGEDTKESVRKEALERDLVGAHKGESQNLCFVPDGDYVRFIEHRAGDRVRRGWIVDESGNRLAPHQGIHRFTLGQRKGLGVAVGHPVFVSRIHSESGTVVVSGGSEMDAREARIAAPIIAAGVCLPTRARVQVRYRHDGADAQLRLGSDSSLVIAFDEAVRAVSPGQYAVAYGGDMILAGGIISAVGR